MNPEDRLRALNDSERWTVNALTPRENPFGSATPVRRRQSWRLILAEIAVVAAVGAAIIGVIAVQNRSAPDISDKPAPVMPTSTPSPDVTAPPQPSNTPEPPPANAPVEPAVSRIVISSSGVQLQAKSGDVLEEFGYFESDADAMVDALNDLFDAKPAVTHVAGDDYTRPSDHLDWGGLIIYDYEGEVSAIRQDFSIVAWASEVEGVSIVTADGVGIGTPVSRVQTLEDEEGDDSFREDHEGYWYLDWVLYDETYEPSPGEETPVFATYVVAEDGSDVVTRVQAPSRNFGD